MLGSGFGGFSPWILSRIQGSGCFDNIRSTHLDGVMKNNKNGDGSGGGVGHGSSGGGGGDTDDGDRDHDNLRVRVIGHGSSSCNR